MDAQFAPILAIQIESELTVPYDSESSMLVEHPERIGHIYPQNRTPHHPLLIQVNPTMSGCCCLSTVEVFGGTLCLTTCLCLGSASEFTQFSSILLRTPTLHLVRKWAYAIHFRTFPVC
jgi:hypothetical protein